MFTPQADRETSWADSPAGATAVALLCAAAAAGIGAPALASAASSPPRSLALALLFSSAVGGVAAAASRRRADTGSLLTAALWLAPLALFAWAGSWAALPAAVAFAALAAGMFRRLVAGDEPASEKSFLLMPPAPPEAQRRARGARIATALAYCGAGFAAAGEILPGAAFLAAAVAIVVWLRAPMGASRQGLKAGIALAVTVVALLPERWAGFRLVAPQAEQGEEGPRVPERPDLFSGVILLTNAKYEPPVELPPLPRRFAPPTRPAQLSSIRFSGEYWYFFWPRSGPGSDALRKLGSPLQLSYNAVDMSALIMQARQPLPKPIKLDCCSAIDVVLESNERDPGSVEVELILIDSTREGAPRLSLGWRALTAGSSTPETLRFETLPEAGFPAFNELLVWFHLGMERKARSARLAVERFDLTP